MAVQPAVFGLALLVLKKGFVTLFGGKGCAGAKLEGLELGTMTREGILSQDIPGNPPATATANSSPLHHSSASLLDCIHQLRAPVRFNLFIHIAIVYPSIISRLFRVCILGKRESNGTATLTH